MVINNQGEQQNFPWVVPLGTPCQNHRIVGPNLRNKIPYIFLYNGLFDWTRWAMFSPPMHTLMKNNEHPKTYKVH
jgi:hypothetical protein